MLHNPLIMTEAYIDSSFDAQTLWCIQTLPYCWDDSEEQDHVTIGMIVLELSSYWLLAIDHSSNS